MRTPSAAWRPVRPAPGPLSQSLFSRFRRLLNSVSTDDTDVAGDHDSHRVFVAFENVARDDRSPCGLCRPDTNRSIICDVVVAGRDVPAGMNADRDLCVIEDTIIKHIGLTGFRFFKTDADGFIPRTFVSGNHRPRVVLTADSCQRVLAAPVIANDRLTRFLGTDTGHIVFIAVIIFDDRPGILTGANAAARSAIVMALVSSHYRTGSFADPLIPIWSRSR